MKAIIYLIIILFTVISFSELSARPPQEVQLKKNNSNNALKTSKTPNRKIVYIEDKNADSFFLTFYFNVGSWDDKRLKIVQRCINESSQNTQITHMMPFHWEIEEYWTTFTISGENKDLERAIKSVYNFLATPPIYEAEWPRLKKNVSDKRESEKTTDRNIIAQAIMSYAMFGPHNPFNHTMNQQELQELTLQDVTYIMNYIKAQTQIITYSGPHTLKEVKTSINRNSSPSSLKIKKIKNSQRKSFQPEYIMQNRVLLTHINSEKTSDIIWVKNNDIINKNDIIFNNIFGIYFNNQSQLNLHSEFSHPQTTVMSEVRFPHNIYFPTVTVNHLKHDTTSDKTTIDSLITLCNQYLNEITLDSTYYNDLKEQYISSILSSNLEQQKLLNYYMFLKRTGINKDYREESISFIRTSTLADVMAYHKKNVSIKPYTYCVISHENNVTKEMLQKYGVVKVLSSEELFGY